MFTAYATDGTKLEDGDARRPAYYTARARYGRGDGAAEPGRKQARGKSRQAAERALKAAIRDAVQAERERAEDVERGKVIPRDWTGFVANHAAYIASDDSGLADGSVRIYSDAIRNHLTADSCPFAGRRLESITQLELRDWLQTIANVHGNGAAHSAKSVVNGMFKRAVGYQIVPANPAAGMGEVKRTRKTADKIRAEREREAANKGEELIERDHGRGLTVEDQARLIAFLERPQDERTGPGRKPIQDQDVADLIRFMLGTGCRIGEALGLRWEDVDLTPGRERITIAATIVRTKEHGVVRQAHGKTDGAQRTIYVDSVAAGILRRRFTEDESQGGDRPNREGVVFPSTTGGLWETRNAGRKLRKVFDHKDVGLSWAVPHTLRRTVINDLLDGGMSAPKVAAHVGHTDPSFTLKVYGDAKTTPDSAGSVLDLVRSRSIAVTKEVTNEDRPDLRVVS